MTERAEDLLGDYELKPGVARGFFSFAEGTEKTFQRAVYVIRPQKNVAASEKLDATLEAEAKIFARADGALPRFLHFGRTPVPHVVLERAPSVAFDAPEVRALGVRAKFALAAQLFRSLAACHAREIHFRHLTPESLRVGERGVIIADTGCFVGDADEALRPPLDVRFASPEAILGESTDPRRSDVFVVAIHAHALILGEHPFAGDHGEISHNIRTTDPKPLTFEDETLSLAARSLARSLSKRPTQRSGSALDIAEEIERALGIDPKDFRVIASSLGLVRPPADPPIAPRARGAPRRAEILLLGLGWLAFVGVVEIWRYMDRDAIATPASSDPAKVYFVARPWAEIWVDGALIDTTPRARPWEVKPGRHEVIFRHPQAPDEMRVVEALPGQTVRLDAEMKITRPVVPEDAGADASP